MEQVNASAIVRVGVDLAKRVIQLHAVDATGRVVTSRPLPREKFLSWCAQLPPGCVIVMESCSGAHHWDRRLCAHGAGRPACRQPLRRPLLHARQPGQERRQRRGSDLRSRQPTAYAVRAYQVNSAASGVGNTPAARGLQGFGLVFPQSPQALREQLADTIEDAANEMPRLARVALQQAQRHWMELDEHIAWCDQRIAEHVRADEQARAAVQLMGIGPITAMANKNARILWAVLAKGRRFDPGHAPVKPQGSVMAGPAMTA